MVRESTLSRFAAIRRGGAGLYLACGFLAAAILGVDLAIPLGVAGGVPYIAVVLISLWAHDKRFTVLAAGICSILTLVGFLYSASGGEMWQVVFNRLLALFAIWVTAFITLQREAMAAKREQAIFDREKALEDVKVLRGFLPICASCKKIRDDKGYWSQIELYIRDHSEADFSHGICPECFEKLYPELQAEDDANPKD